MANQNEHLKNLTIKGYKTISNLDNFSLRDINIFIGANGAGKSNFIGIFKFLFNIYEERLQVYTAKSGGVDSFLHYGRKNTDKIEMEFDFENNSYSFVLSPTDDNKFLFEKERAVFHYKNTGDDIYDSLGSGHLEAKIQTSKSNKAPFVREVLSSWRIYHFHDTSDSAKVKGKCRVTDNIRLKPDGENLAAYLKLLKQDDENSYQSIVETIQVVAPFFNDFYFREDEYIQLEWLEIGNPDTPFIGKDLSDGTLRFILLATLLLQPAAKMPSTIIIDEPELGLHPYALRELASLIKRASDTTQLIIASQSVELISHFTPEDIVVTNRTKDGETTFDRLNSDELRPWLEDYTLGGLWTSNLISGTPK